MLRWNSFWLIWSFYSYELTDGQKRNETIDLVKNDNGDEEIVSQGSYEFVGMYGERYRITYIADKNGYRPQVTLIQPQEVYVSSQVIKSLVG